MEADDELLEAAALAAWVQPPDHVAANGSWVWREPHKKNWNPLIDDGDALRLAVKLRLCVDHGKMTAYATRGAVSISEHVATNADDCAATRRAIVRAAAAIGCESPHAPQ